MSYRYTLEEILQFSIDKLSSFSVTSFVWNIVNEVGTIMYIIYNMYYNIVIQVHTPNLIFCV